MPKEICSRAHLDHVTVKVTCRRLAEKQVIIRDVAGYHLPSTAFEYELQKQLRVSGQKQSLPKIHDIHLTFKTENLPEILAQKPELRENLDQVLYFTREGGPVKEKLHKANKEGYKNRPCLLPPGHELEGHAFLDRVFNVFDPMSIYQLWTGVFKNINGGIQETFDFRTYKVIVQLFGTGTIKVLVSNSEHPFDAQQFREALATIDGIFYSKTGVRFLDISTFFYIEKAHFNNDILGDREYSGTSRLNCTVKQLDDWLYRVYEKVLGDDLYIRNEACLENGNYEDHNLNGMLALIQGGVNPTLVTAQAFKTHKDQEELIHVVERQQREIHDLYSMVKAIGRKVLGTDPQSEDEQPSTVFQSAHDTMHDAKGGHQG